MDIQQLLQTLKSSVKQHLKYQKHLRQGYAQHYARSKRVEAEKFSHLWGQCVTPIKQRSGAADINQNRHWNMQLAITSISGLVLQPGEIFSFWHQVPQPTSWNGFRSGPMLVRGTLKTDVGGGLCQISTTLFGAFLQANLEMLEHHNHSIDAHGSDRFFVLGQDAAVAYGYKDLIARNTSSVPLQIRITMDGDRSSLDVSIWGTEPCPRRVRLVSEVIEPLPSPEAEGISGWRVETQRWVASTVDLLETEQQIEQMNYCFVSVYAPCAATSTPVPSTSLMHSSSPD